MATGIERLMKSFGIDPEKIMETFQGQMTEVVQQVKAEFDMLHDRMSALETRLEQIEKGLLHNLPNYVPGDAQDRLEKDQASEPYVTDIPLKDTEEGEADHGR